MKKSLLSLTLLGFFGCNEKDNNSQSISSKTIFEPSINYNKLSSDVVNWTSDGKIDLTERIDIMRKCGYEVKTYFGWFRRGIYVHDGNDWVNVTSQINDFPINLNHRFIENYQK